MNPKKSPKDTLSMSLGGHLKELRAALIRLSLVLFFSAVIGFYFSDFILGALTRPLSAKLVFLSPAEVFLTDIKIALFSGLTLAVPFVLYELWRFIAPGLIQKERDLFIPFLIFSSVSFYIGLAFSYLVALPFALKFLVAYGQQKGIVPAVSIAMYVDFNLKFLFAFGLIFELPVVMILLSKTGLLTHAFLSHYRKYAVVAAFIIAAILTPTPDVFNQCLMAIPLIVLYEIGVLGVRLFGRTVPRVEEGTDPL